MMSAVSKLCRGSRRRDGPQPDLRDKSAQFALFRHHRQAAIGKWAPGKSLALPALHTLKHRFEIKTEEVPERNVRGFKGYRLK